MEWLTIVLALAVTGLIAGVLAGLLGVGGGIVIVPVLFFVFQAIGVSSDSAMLIATGTSLVIIIATSISSIRAHHAKGNVDLALVRLWWPFIVLGALGGVLLSTHIGGKFASVVFGCTAILVACNMLFRASSAPLLAQLPGKSFQAILAVVIGGISVIMGIGGGTLGVPLLTACNLPAHRAVGTAAAFGFIIAVPGASLLLLLASTPVDAPRGTYGFINLIGVALIMPLSVVMAPVGVKLGSLINGTTLKRIFALFLVLSGLRMMMQALA